MKSKPIRAKNARDRLIAAASDLFVAHGLNGTSTSQISKLAGVKESSIELLFGGKNELWQATMDHLSNSFIDKQLTALAQGENRGVELLTDAIAGYFNLLRNNPDAIRLHSWRFLEGNAKPSQRLVSLTQIGIVRLKQSQKEGKLRADLPAEFIWASFISFATGWFHLRSQFGDLLQKQKPGEDIDQLFLETITQIFLEGINPREPE